MLCLSPMSLPRPKGLGSIDRITVPCGKCYPCLANKRNQWAFRIQQQLKNAVSAYFITLTYDNDHTKGNLSKYDIQCFLKRLRKDWALNDLKYYLIGEYGPTTFRPHYHGIFFNLPKNPENKLISSWKNGFVHVGQVTPASIKYATKYMITKEQAPDGLYKPFMLVSKGMGLGYVEKHKKWHIDTERFYCPDGSRKVPLSRYYRDKIFNKQEIHLNKLRNEVKRIILDDQKLEKLKLVSQNPYAYMQLQKEQIQKNGFDKITKTTKI